MKYVIANDIRIEQPSQEVISYANAQLILDNPEYAKKEKVISAAFQKIIDAVKDMQ